MRSQAFFSGTHEHIAKHMLEACKSIKVNVNSFTNRDLFDVLVICQRRGVSVSLAISEKPINRHSSIAWERLTVLGGEVFWIPVEVEHETYQQFCLIDDTTVISGNFNWIKNIKIDDFDSILIQSVDEVNNYFEELFNILIGSKLIKNSVEVFGCSLSIDPEISRKHIQAQVLQERIISVESEISDVKKQLNLYAYKKNEAIGDLLQRYLEIKRRYLHYVYRKNRQPESRHEADDAEYVYQQYKQVNENILKDEKPVELDKDQQKEIKQLYRKLAMQCHPDRVDDDCKPSAKVFFQKLQFCYLNNDLISLKNLKFEMESELPKYEALDLQNESVRINQHLIDLKLKLTSLMDQLSELCQSVTWRELTSKPNWNIWFAQQAENLQFEMHRYEIQLVHAADEIKA